jgi:Caspase domain
MSSHVSLAACRQEEQAFETTSIKNEQCGAFSDSLMQVLQNCNISETTPSDLITRVQQTLRPKQHPQCEGVHKDRFLFTTTTRHYTDVHNANNSAVLAPHHDGNDLICDYLTQKLMPTKYRNDSTILDWLLGSCYRPCQYDVQPLKGLFTVCFQRLEEQPGDQFLAPTGNNLFVTPRNFDARGSSKVPDIMEAVIPCSDQQYYGLTLENHSQYNLFPYVLYFNPDRPQHPNVRTIFWRP